MYEKIIFMNIGWMSEYSGLSGTDNKIFNGGKYVGENRTGGGVCNFLSADDGFYYGFVERNSREIHLEKWDDDKISDNVLVIWTASSKSKGKCIVGFYQNATVYSVEQNLTKKISEQHSKDKLQTYSVCAREDEVFLFPENDRYEFKLPPRWVRNWRIFDDKVNYHQEISELVKRLKAYSVSFKKDQEKARRTKKSGSANSSPKSEFIRYVQEYEVLISPLHNKVQKSFRAYLEREEFSKIYEDRDLVDIRFKTKEGELVLAEVKPCTQRNARFAIRLAMGQLLDYKDRLKRSNAKLLIVLESKPTENDEHFAKSNGFGIAYPTVADLTQFSVSW